MIVEKRVAKTEAVGLDTLIKPAAPLLACEIRRVFFYRATAPRQKGEPR